MPSKFIFTATASVFLLTFASASNADLLGVDVSADIGSGGASASASVGSSSSASASASTSGGHGEQKSNSKKHSGFQWPWQKAKPAVVPVATKKVAGVLKHAHKDLHGSRGGHGKDDKAENSAPTSTNPVQRVTRDDTANQGIRPAIIWDRSKAGMPIYSSDGHLLGVTNALESGNPKSMLVHANIARDLGIRHSEVMLRMASVSVRNDKIVFGMTRSRFIQHMSQS